MSNMYKYVLCFLTVWMVMNVPCAHGNFISGSEIHYIKVDSLTYDVIFTIYRSCQGLKLNNPSLNCNVSNNDGSNSKSVSLTLVSITEATPICRKLANPCSPPNTAFTGLGDERHVYKCRVDFRKNPYDSVYKSGKPIIFSFKVCCRSSSITNGAGNYIHYNYALLNLSLGEVNGALFGTEVNPHLLAGLAHYSSLGAKGFSPDDSISFAFGPVLKGFNDKITTTVPFTCYDPAGKGAVLPNSNPPIGMFLDAKTGDWIFTPISGNDLSAVVHEMKVWRKNTSGQYEVISVIRRDFQYRTSTYSASGFSPIFSSVSTWNVCEGEKLDAVVSTTFASKLVDTVHVIVLDTIAGSSNVVLTGSAKQSFKFSWTPPNGSARNQPYTFTLSAHDSLCPYVIKSSRTFSVYVKPRPEAKVSVDVKNCNVVQVKSTLISNVVYPEFSWRILDSTGAVVGIDKVYFPASKTSSSNQQVDSFYVLKSGKYFVEHSITGANKCSFFSYDTINVTSNINQLFKRSDTIFCKNLGLSLKQDLHADSLYTSYKWSNGDSSSTTKLTYTGMSEPISLRANSKTGCFYFDNIGVNHSEKPIFIKPDEVAQCFPLDTLIRLKVKNPYTFMSTQIQWKLSKSDSLKITKSGMYKMQATNYCGTSMDSVLILGLQRPQINMGSADTFGCIGGALTLDPQPKDKFATYSFLWSDGSGLAQLVVNKAGVYSVAVSNICGQTSDTIRVTKFIEKPEVGFTNKPFICNGIPLVMGGTYPDSKLLWSTGETTNNITVSKPQKIALKVTNGCGVDEDSISIVNETDPKVTLPKDTFYCNKIPVKLTGGTINAWYVWSTGDKNRVTHISKSGTYSVLAENGCGKDSATITITEKQKPLVNLGKDTSLLSTNLVLNAGNTGDSYLWSTGANTKSIEIHKQGLYWAEAKNACGSHRDSILIKFSGIKHLENTGYQIYPNPSRGYFTIVSETALDPSQIAVFSADGKLLDKVFVTLQQTLSNTVDCNITLAAEGLYFVSITNNQANINFQILKY